MHADTRRPTRRAPGATLPRRSVLAGVGAGAVLALAACTDTGPGPTPTGADDPDFSLRGKVFDAEQALIASYDATVARHPTLRARLAPIREQHAAHAAAMSVGGDLPGQGRPRPAVAAIPADADAAVAALARLESAAAAARVVDCAAATRGDLARIVSLVGGSEASHVVVLGGSS